MTVLAFVMVLAIPVAMLAKRAPFTVTVCAIFGLFLGMTPIGTNLAGGLNTLGHSALHLAANTGPGTQPNTGSTTSGGRP